jgi:hypothetical protein
MNLATQPKKQIVIPQLAATGRFGNFKAEPEREVRKVSLERDNEIEVLKRMWEKISMDLERDYHFEVQNYSGAYAKILKMARKSRYSAKDICAFSLALPEFQGDAFFRIRAGIFLSALINNCKDQEFVIHTAHLPPIHFIGFDNKKNIVVEGDAGNRVGVGMKGGSIIVKGDAGMVIGGEMIDGTISILGNAGSHIGYFMQGGSITVGKHAGTEVGRRMHAGEIRLNGGYDEIADYIQGGRIYHKRKLIWPRGGGSE